MFPLNIRKYYLPDCLKIAFINHVVHEQTNASVTWLDASNLSHQAKVEVINALGDRLGRG